MKTCQESLSSLCLPSSVPGRPPGWPSRCHPCSQPHSAWSSCVPLTFLRASWPGSLGLFLSSLHLSDLQVHTQRAVPRPQIADAECRITGSHEVRRLQKPRPGHHCSPTFQGAVCFPLTCADTPTGTQAETGPRVKPFDFRRKGACSTRVRLFQSPFLQPPLWRVTHAAAPSTALWGTQG